MVCAYCKEQKPHPEVIITIKTKGGEATVEFCSSNCVRYYFRKW